jgi:hypothetical protein
MKTLRSCTTQGEVTRNNPGRILAKKSKRMANPSIVYKAAKCDKRTITGLTEKNETAKHAARYSCATGVFLFFAQAADRARRASNCATQSRLDQNWPASAIKIPQTKTQ